MTSISDDAITRPSISPEDLSPVLSQLSAELGLLSEAVEPREGVIASALSGAVRQASEALTELSAHLDAGLELPLSVALIGGTNTGKSTTLNLIAGREISRERVTANATKRPLIYAHERWRAPLMSERRPWPRPERSEDRDAPVNSEASDTPLLTLHQDERLQELILIDCPDLDSTETMNVQSATDVTRWADRVLFLVTPQKYKDKLLVEALRALLLRGQRAHVLFNLITEAHDCEEMIEDLQSALALTPERSALLSFERPLARLPHEGRESLAQGLQAQLLTPLLGQDHHAEREALLQTRSRRALSAIDEVVKALRVAEGSLEELALAFKRFSAQTARELSASRTALISAEGARLHTALSALTLPELCTSLKRSARSAGQPQQGRPPALPPLLRASLLATASAWRAAHAWLSAQLINDALNRIGLGERSAAKLEASAKLTSITLEGLRGLSQALEELTTQGSSSPAEQIFTFDVRRSLPGDQALSEALLGGSSRSEVDDLRAELRRRALRELNLLISDPRSLDPLISSLTVGAPEQHKLSGVERAQLIGMKAVCGVLLAYFSLGLGPWDLMWAPLGFELGTYLAAWRLRLTSRHRGGHEVRADEERAESALNVNLISPLTERVELKRWSTGELARAAERLDGARDALRGQLI